MKPMSICLLNIPLVLKSARSLIFFLFAFTTMSQFASFLQLNRNIIFFPAREIPGSAQTKVLNSTEMIPSVLFCYKHLHALTEGVHVFLTRNIYILNPLISNPPREGIFNLDHPFGLQVQKCVRQPMHPCLISRRGLP